MTREWLERAVCIGADPVMFDHETEEAFQICQSCPVIAECRADAMQPAAEGGSWGPGIRGGLTLTQRIALKRNGRYRAAKLQPQPNPRAHSQLTDAERAKRLDLWFCGLSDSAIAEQCGVTADSIRGWRVRYRSVKYPEGLSPNKTHWGPLTLEQHAERAELVAQGLSNAAIAEQCGVTEKTIWTWRQQQVSA